MHRLFIIGSAAGSTGTKYNVLDRSPAALPTRVKMWSVNRGNEDATAFGGGGLTIATVGQRGGDFCPHFLLLLRHTCKTDYIVCGLSANAPGHGTRSLLIQALP